MDRLKKLRVNSQQRRIERYKIIYTWKILQSLVPNCGIEIATEAEDRLGRRCKIPSFNIKTKPAIQRMRDASFQVTGPKLFNSLPKELRNSTNLNLIEFKEK